MEKDGACSSSIEHSVLVQFIQRGDAQLAGQKPDYVQ